MTSTRWRPPTEPSGGQCVALDENGEECAAFYDYRTGRWHLCSNIVSEDTVFQPLAWTPLPRQEASDGR